MQLGRETIDYVGLGAAKNDTVVTVNLVVAVDVGILQVARLGCLSVDGGQFGDILVALHDTHELEAIESTEGFALAQDLLLVGTLDDVVGGTHIGNLVLIISGVGADAPVQILALQEAGIDREFETFIHHITYILKLRGDAAGEAHGHLQK